MRQVSLSAAVGRVPFFHHDALDPPHRFFFGDARIGDPIQMLFQQFHFLLRSEVPVVRDAPVMICATRL